MKTFALPESSLLKVVKVTPRKEMHGKELVQAISLRLEWCPASNESLNLVHAGLLDMLFWTPPEVAAQCTLEGVPPVKVHMRVPSVTQPIKVKLELSGYGFTIDHGISEDSALELYACDVDNFDVSVKEGGSSTAIRFSIGSNQQITPQLVGALCALDGTDVVATLTPPTVSEIIDGTVAAFKADHPESSLFDPEAPTPDATELFVAGADDAGDDDGDDLEP